MMSKSTRKKTAYKLPGKYIASIVGLTTAALVLTGVWGMIPYALGIWMGVIACKESMRAKAIVAAEQAATFKEGDI